MWKAYDTHDKKEVALKLIDRKITPKSIAEKQRNALLDEMNILHKVQDGPHILKFIRGAITPTQYVIVTELCTGGDLFDLIDSYYKRRILMKESDTMHIIRQVLEAVAYCHAKEIVHCDIKPENIMLTQPFTPGTLPDIKLIDFGLAQRLPRGGKLTRAVGTPSYAAPEVLSRSYDEKADLWSIGAMTYLMLTGQEPALPNRIVPTEVILEKRNWVESLPEQLRRLSDLGRLSHLGGAFNIKLLNMDPTKRPSAKEALQDPWLAPATAGAAADVPAAHQFSDNRRSLVRQNARDFSV